MCKKKLRKLLVMSVLFLYYSHIDKCTYSTTRQLLIQTKIGTQSSPYNAKQKGQPLIGGDQLLLMYVCNCSVSLFVIRTEDRCLVEGGKHNNLLNSIQSLAIY